MSLQTPFLGQLSEEWLGGFVGLARTSVVVERKKKKNIFFLFFIGGDVRILCSVGSHTYSFALHTLGYFLFILARSFDVMTSLRRCVATARRDMT